MVRWSLVLFFLPVILTLCSLSQAQVNPGFPSFQPQDCHEVDCVNLASNNVTLNLPVMSKSGAFPFRYSLLGSFYPFIYSGATQWTMISNVSGSALAGDTGFYKFAGNVNSTVVNCPGGGTTTKYTNYFIQDVHGTYHWLPQSDYTDSVGCLNATFTDQVIDGAGYTLTATKGSVGSPYTRGGMTISACGGSCNGLTGSITDSNGNKLSYTTSNGTKIYTDTLGTTALTGLAWTDVSGGSPSITINQATSSYLTGFGCPGINEGSGLWSDVSSISYPDGTSMGVTYEQTPGLPGRYTGRLAQLTLRHGGAISYQYLGGSNGINCTYQTVPQLKRITSDGTTVYTLAYSLISGSNYKATNTVTDSGGNQTIYTFTGYTSAGTAAFPTFQPVTQVARYQGSSTLLTTDVYCYNTAFASCSFSSAPNATVTLPITSVVVMHKISGMASTSAAETHYDSYGNITYSAQYDFGGTTPTIATTTTYGTWNGSSCVAISTIMHDKPCDVVTKAGTNTISESRFAYDSKGNLLTTYVWNGSTFLSNSTANVYNANGTISTSYDVNNTPTTFTYDPASYISCGASCTNYPFPTSVSKGGLTTYSTWNAVGAVKVTDKDANGNTTSYAYTACVGGAAEPFWRVMSITDPLGSVVCKTNPSGSAPTTINSTFTFNASLSTQNTTTTTDAYGRTTRVQTAQSPTATNYDTITTSYGWSSPYRTVSTSQPCSTTLGSDCTTVHTSSFDPLGRLYQATTTSNETVMHTYTQNDDLVVLSPAPANENNKQVQKEYDGLGRIKKSCAIGNGSSTACGQNTGTANGLTTSFSYSFGAGTSTTTSTRGAQTHTTIRDAMGRVTQTTTPEGGTIQYTYDANSGCPGSINGYLTAVNMPANGWCIYRDALGRVTSMHASYSGTGTACRYFYYDNSTGYSGTIPTGITIANSMGRMVEAATAACSGNTLITDEWFSYDKDGRVTDMWEKTPNSGQYYHSIATFYENGAVNTLQLATPSLYTMTYGLDGEGRWYTLKQGASQNIVTGASSPGPMYNAAGAPIEIDLTGNTTVDKDTYTYDPNTGRMTTFTFQVSTPAKTLAGQLNWNPNGTLNNLAITDGFNSGGTQTCYFNPSSGTGMGYDDWGRLLQSICGPSSSPGSLWNQTFSYDQYNNLTKTASGPGVTWNPGYNSANNRYTLAGTTYDANGNLTNDTLHGYEWDEYSKLKSVDRNGTGCATDGECIIYDAMGRAVEIDQRLDEDRNLVYTTRQDRVYERVNTEVRLLARSRRRNCNRQWHLKLLLLHAQGLAGERPNSFHHQRPLSHL